MLKKRGRLESNERNGETKQGNVRTCILMNYWPFLLCIFLKWSGQKPLAILSCCEINKSAINKLDTCAKESTFTLELLESLSLNCKYVGYTFLLQVWWMFSDLHTYSIMCYISLTVCPYHMIYKFSFLKSWLYSEELLFCIDLKA